MRDAGLTFIGPTPEAIALMGSKTAARAAAIARGRAGRARHRRRRSPADVLRRGDRAASRAAIGYPLLVKAVAGGGGKGMRTVVDPRGSGAAPSARRGRKRARRSATPPSTSSAGSSRPRHIEVQLLGDQHGTVLPFVERECSIQRRHQKVVEETPSLAVTPELRRRMTAAAASVARAVGYTNAGTIEFLLDEDGRFYFLEMNTRLQVEHPITEMVTGVDLVRWQIRIARGERLDLDPERLLTPNGHAIECRIYAEDPDNNFLPSPGRILELRAPAGPGHPRRQRRRRRARRADLLRPDDLEAGRRGREDRPAAIARMRRALAEYVVAGIKTTVPFFPWLLDQPEFVDGPVPHDVSRRGPGGSRSGRPFASRTPEAEEVAAIAAALQTHARRRVGVGAAERRGAAAPAAAGRSQARAEGLRWTCSTTSRSTAASGRSSSGVTDGTFVVDVDGRVWTVDAVRVDRAHVVAADRRSTSRAVPARHGPSCPGSAALSATR